MGERGDLLPQYNVEHEYLAYLAMRRGPGGGSGVGATGPAGPGGATGQQGPTGPGGATGPAGGGAGSYSLFFALQGTDPQPIDNPGTIAPGAPVLFPRNGPTNGAAVRATGGTFTLTAGGVYEVGVQVSFSPAGQLALALNGVKIDANSLPSQIGRATSTTQGVIHTVITANPGDVLSVINPGSHGTALTITPNAGGDAPEGSVSSTLFIKKLP